MFNGGNQDSPTLQRILDIMSKLQRSNKKIQKAIRRVRADKERQKEEANIEQERLREEVDEARHQMEEALKAKSCKRQMRNYNKP